MITRKALIAKLKAMNPDTVLLATHQRCYHNNGSRYMAGSVVLEKLTGVDVVGQQSHCGRSGVSHKNPKWLTQLFTEIMWSVGVVHAGDVLQHLAA